MSSRRLTPTRLAIALQAELSVGPSQPAFPLLALDGCCALNGPAADKRALDGGEVCEPSTKRAKTLSVRQKRTITEVVNDLYRHVQHHQPLSRLLVAGLSGSVFDLTTDARDLALRIVAGTNMQYKNALIALIPKLTEFEKEMVRKEVIVFTRGVFEMKLNKLSILISTTKNFEFGMKCFLWYAPYAPHFDFRLHVVDADNKIQDNAWQGSSRVETWDKITDRLVQLYGGIKEYLLGIADGTEIDVSWLETMEMDVRAIEHPSLDRQYLAKDLKRTSNGELKTHELEIKEKAMEVEEMIQKRANELGKNRPSYGTIMDDDDFRSIVQEHWDPFVRSRHRL